MPDRESTLIPGLKKVRSAFACLTLVVSGFSSAAIQAAEREGVAAGEFEGRIKPLLEQYCYDCHGDGASEGEVSSMIPSMAFTNWIIRSCGCGSGRISVPI